MPTPMVSLTAKAALTTAMVISQPRRVRGVRHRVRFGLGLRMASRLVMTCLLTAPVTRSHAVAGYQATRPSP